ncbi:hypothetical protein [Pseudarthrobacter cellobiosi]|uniref:hypothetical protein n=1 Tax=Pseudarthrobacter cellobiosi TaxID=2953654 RepID=UPI00208DED48|nr:hypothetical protein [Pseudarthrobacter sp. HLT1-5]MCO4257359.1 hypothetical protein [Pseudarthrobacter sp. HLT1-5]
MSKLTFAEFSKFQRLNYVQIAPSGSLVALAGKNKQGKSSILDGLEAAICGHNGRVITRPINDGADKAAITVETDDGLQVTRTYTPAGSKLVIKAADGAKYGQAKLDSLIGSLGLDASQFASLNDKDQLKTLLGLVELPFDPATLEDERKAIFDQRTEANRREKELTAQVARFLALPADLPAEEVSVSALVTAYREGQALNAKIIEADAAVSTWTRRVEQLTAELATAQEQLDNASDYSAKAPAPVDVDTIQHKIDGAEVTNAQVRAAQEKARLEASLKDADAASDDLTAKLAAIDKRKADGLAAAIFPVDDLSFDEEGVLYKGRPFNRASSAEKVLVSAAMMIALNPELRVLIVRNGNDLDSDSLTALETMAADADFQVFIEIVNETGDFGITIEDGEVAA